jgi:hypothetical protein
MHIDTTASGYTEDAELGSYMIDMELLKSIPQDYLLNDQYPFSCFVQWVTHFLDFHFK